MESKCVSDKVVCFDLGEACIAAAWKDSTNKKCKRLKTQFFCLVVYWLGWWRFLCYYLCDGFIYECNSSLPKIQKHTELSPCLVNLKILYQRTAIHSFTLKPENAFSDLMLLLCIILTA